MMNNPCWGWGMWFMPLLIFFSIYFISRIISQNKFGQTTDTPLDILKKRYAKGEITKEQFDEMKNNIS